MGSGLAVGVRQPVSKQSDHSLRARLLRGQQLHVLHLCTGHIPHSLPPAGFLLLGQKRPSSFRRTHQHWGRAARWQGTCLAKDPQQRRRHTNVKSGQPEGRSPSYTRKERPSGFHPLCPAHSESSDSKQLEIYTPELLNMKTDQNTAVSAKRVLNKLHSISLKQLPELQPRIT